MPAIDKVPLEVWARVANHASPLERKALSATCRVLHHAARDPIEPRRQEARAILQADPIRMAPDQVDALLQGVRRLASKTGQRVHGDKLVNACKQQRSFVKAAHDRDWREELRTVGPHVGYLHQRILARRPIPTAESAALFGLGLVSIGVWALNLAYGPCLGYVVELTLYGAAAACHKSNLQRPRWMGSRFDRHRDKLFGCKDLALASGVVGLFAITFVAFCTTSINAMSLLQGVFDFRCIAVVVQGVFRCAMGLATMILAVAEHFCPPFTFVDAVFGPDQRQCSEQQLAERFLTDEGRARAAHGALMNIKAQPLGYRPVTMASTVESAEPRTWVPDLRTGKWLRHLVPKPATPISKRL